MNGKPKIKCGYCGWIIAGSCGNIQQHKCFEKYKEDAHLVHIDENYVAKMIPRYDNNKNSRMNIAVSDDVIPVEDDCETKSDDNTDEILIELVFQRPVLWNYKLPVQDRTNLKKNALWFEVSNGIGGGNATVKWVKSRWKDLRDAYIKARKKVKAYVPSGSDTATAKKLRKSSFRFFERMQFLEVALATESTVTSLPSKSTSLLNTLHYNLQSDSSCSESLINLDTDRSSSSLSSNTVKTSTSEPNSSRTSKNNRKRHSNIGHSDIQESLLEVLREPLKQPDAVDGILIKLGEGLRRLPYRERSLLEIKWLNELIAAEERCPSQ